MEAYPANMYGYDIASRSSINSFIGLGSYLGSYIELCLVKIIEPFKNTLNIKLIYN